MKRTVLRIGRTLAAILSAGVLVASGAAQVRADPAPCACPAPAPVTARNFWPGPDAPNVRFAVFEYRLTNAYWASFQDCLDHGCPFERCAETLPSDYVVVRTQ